MFEVGAAPGSAGKSQKTMICTWLCEIYLHQVLLEYATNISTDMSNSHVLSLLT